MLVPFDPRNVPIIGSFVGYLVGNSSNSNADADTSNANQPGSLSNSTVTNLTGELAKPDLESAVGLDQVWDALPPHHKVKLKNKEQLQSIQRFAILGFINCPPEEERAKIVFHNFENKLFNRSTLPKFQAFYKQGPMILSINTMIKLHDKKETANQSGTSKDFGIALQVVTTVANTAFNQLKSDCLALDYHGEADEETQSRQHVFLKPQQEQLDAHGSLICRLTVGAKKGQDQLATFKRETLFYTVLSDIEEVPKLIAHSPYDSHVDEKVSKKVAASKPWKNATGTMERDEPLPSINSPVHIHETDDGKADEKEHVRDPKKLEKVKGLEDFYANKNVGKPGDRAKLLKNALANFVPRRERVTNLGGLALENSSLATRSGSIERDSKDDGKTDLLDNIDSQKHVIYMELCQDMTIFLRGQLNKKAELLLMPKFFWDGLHGLMEFEKRGIIHGDIKRENLLVKENKLAYKLKFTDFGGMRYINEEPTFTGTYGYFSPERRNSPDPICPSTLADDIYALGTTFRFMLGSETVMHTLLNYYLRLEYYLNDLNEKKLHDEVPGHFIHKNFEALTTKIKNLKDRSQKVTAINLLDLNGPLDALHDQVLKSLDPLYLFGNKNQLDKRTVTAIKATMNAFLDLIEELEQVQQVAFEIESVNPEPMKAIKIPGDELLWEISKEMLHPNPEERQPASVLFKEYGERLLALDKQWNPQNYAGAGANPAGNSDRGDKKG